MQLFSIALFAFVCLTAASAKLHPFYTQYHEGQRYFLAPGKDGKVQVVDLEAKEDTRFNAATDVNFLLFTRSNPSSAYVLQNGNSASLSGSRYDRNKRVVIIAHGWNNDGGSPVNTVIRDAYLRVLDVNVIVVDWSKGANGLYTSAVNNVPKVAAWTAQLIDWLVSQGTNINNFHVMGHSLGGHIAGQTGRAVTRGRVPYILGMDPAGPLWGSSSGRIRPSDGVYVEVIHTDAGGLGVKDAVGHNDFYPNGGSNMPGCSIINVGCSHGMVYEYVAESIDNRNFMSQQCSNLDDALRERCSGISQIHMGGASAKAARGIFHLKTNSRTPFALG